MSETRRGGYAMDKMKHRINPGAKTYTVASKQNDLSMWAAEPNQF